MIGYCYAAGQGVRQHWAEALKWYRAAAEQVRLALLLAKVSAGALAALIAGFCAAGPPERAVQPRDVLRERPRRQAGRGCACQPSLHRQDKEHHMLCPCVAFAQVSTWDECWEKAVYWFTLAAEQGDAAAQCNLATCYLKGQGVEQNRPEAIRWYEQAAQRCAHDAGRWWRSQRCLKRVVRGAGAMRRRAGTWRHCWADGPLACRGGRTVAAK